MRKGLRSKVSAVIDSRILSANEAEQYYAAQRFLRAQPVDRREALRKVIVLGERG